MSPPLTALAETTGSQGETNWAVEISGLNKTYRGGKESAAKVALKDEHASAEIIDLKSDNGEATRLGIITLPSFYADFDEGKVRCSVDVERLLERLKEEEIDGLMLDLRNNGCGALE